MVIIKVKPEYIRAILGDKVKHLSDSDINRIINYFDRVDGVDSEFNQFKFIGWKKCKSAKELLKKHLSIHEFDKLVEEVKKKQEKDAQEVGEAFEESVYYSAMTCSYCDAIQTRDGSILYRWHNKKKKFKNFLDTK